MHPSRRRSQTSQRSTPQTHVNFDSFTHLVKRGWSAECVGQSLNVDGSTDLQQHGNDLSMSLDSQQWGGHSDFTDSGSGQPDVDTGFNSEFGWDKLDQNSAVHNSGGDALLEEHRDSGEGFDGGPSQDECHELRSQLSSSVDASLDLDGNPGSIVSNISACVDAAYAMLPLDPTKPVWEQGVWADIFGDGVFMERNPIGQTALQCHALSVWVTRIPTGEEESQI